MQTLFVDHICKLLCNSTHNSLQAYVGLNLPRCTTAIHKKTPTWRRYYVRQNDVLVHHAVFEDTCICSSSI